MFFSLLVNNAWQVAVEVDFDTGQKGVNGQLQASIPGLNVTYSKKVSLSSESSRINFTINVPKVTTRSLMINLYLRRILYKVDHN